MHPLRKLRESGSSTPAQVSTLLVENVVFNSPILARPVSGREAVSAIFAQSSSNCGGGCYTGHKDLSRRDAGFRAHLDWELGLVAQLDREGDVGIRLVPAA